MSKRCNLLNLLSRSAVLLVLFTSACASRGRVLPVPDLPKGAWEATTVQKRVLFEPDRIVVAQDHRQRAMKILQRAPGMLVVRDQGLKETWTVSQEGQTLRLAHGDVAQTYRHLASVPPELDLTPLPLGRPKNLSAQEIQNIQAELVRRRDRDQAVRKDPKLKEEWPAVDADNFAYLRALVQRVGWIDAKRFGKPATAAAILMAKHSSDPRLMQAILPLVEQDMVNSGISAELFSILYDELRISLGYKQRYGTQLNEDTSGPFVLPLEEPKRVDELRKKIGLPPLSEYLAMASKYLYDGKPIRLSRPQE